MKRSKIDAGAICAPRSVIMKKTGSVHVRVWEFRVKTNLEKKFEKIYGPQGGWVRLFIKAKGYLRTEFLRDAETRERYLTVDYWISKEAYENFRRKLGHEFTILGRKCESLTEKETFLGSFSSVANARSAK